MQKAARPLAGLGSSKARPDACMHLGELLCRLLQHRFFGCGVLFRSLLCVHLLHLSEAVYHVLTLTVTVVLEDRFHQPLQWVAAIHADHAEHRHVHAIAIVPERLQVQDFQRMRGAATQEAQAQRHQLELVREQRERSQEQGEGLGLSW